MNPEQNTSLLHQLQDLGDIELPVRAELDRKMTTFGELLDMGPGSVIMLTRPTGENIDLYAGNVLLGWGEVLLLDGKIAVRVADFREIQEPAHTPSGEPATAAAAGS